MYLKDYHEFIKDLTQLLTFILSYKKFKTNEIFYCKEKN